ncbi:unnamed protein product [Pleuronectes platessa]|uniref:Uncharacterized protein n=1 Tax=Pleuronectes platessa TaxID=8262 RepID=A0A9N7U9P8_PLEPL|nr:unnamed protein product [Pleuronectes platessa]
MDAGRRRRRRRGQTWRRCSESQPLESSARGAGFLHRTSINQSDSSSNRARLGANSTLSVPRGWWDRGGPGRSGGDRPGLAGLTGDQIFVSGGKDEEQRRGGGGGVAPAVETVHCSTPTRQRLHLCGARSQSAAAHLLDAPPRSLYYGVGPEQREPVAQ